MNYKKKMVSICVLYVNVLTELYDIVTQTRKITKETLLKGRVIPGLFVSNYMYFSLALSTSFSGKIWNQNK